MNLEQNKFLRFQINPSFMKFQKNKKEKENEIMKRIKKIASLLLAMVMVFAMSVTAFATEGAGQEPNEPATPAGRQYEIYQIFTGEFSTNKDGAEVLSNVKYGQNAKLPEGVEIGDAVTETVLEAVQNISGLGENARAAALAEYANLTSPIKTATGGVTNTINVKGLATGYYLVKDADNSQSGEGQSYTLYIVEVVNEADGLTITPKVGTPEVDKKIVEDDTKTDNNNGAIGSTVNYEIIGTMPSNIGLYNQYFYKFTDTLSKGLTYNSDLEVYVGSKTDTDEKGNILYDEDALVSVKDNTKIVSTEYDEAAGTEIVASISDIKALEKIAGKNIKITADTIIVLRYSATINGNAVIGNPGNPNEVKLTYSNNPNNSGTPKDEPPTPQDPDPTTPTGETPKEKVITYTTELKIFKYEGDRNPLAGVEFTLEGTNLKQVDVKSGVEFKQASEVEGAKGEYYKLKDGTYTTQAPVLQDEKNEDGVVVKKANVNYYETTTADYVKVGTSELKEVPINVPKVTGTVGANGYLTFSGLMVGEYTLTETGTPEGYNTIAPIKFTVSYENGKFTVTSKTEDANGNEVTNVVSEAQNLLSTDIENKKGSLLPSTGGIGTTIFYVVGGILVIGAGILLVTKRRMKAQ